MTTMTPINPLYERFDEVKIGKWLRQEEGKSFVKYLYEIQRQETLSLKNARDLLEIGRCQGRLQVIDKLIKISQEI